MDKTGLMAKIRDLINESRRKEMVVALALLTGAILFLLVEFDSNVPDMCFDKGTVMTYNSQWEAITDEGIQKVDLPAHMDAHKGEVVTFEKRLMGDETRSNTIMIRTAQQYIKVYLDGMLAYSYGSNQVTPIPMEPCSAWHMIQLPEDWSGKTVRIELMSNYEPYAGMLTGVYLGEKNALVYRVLREAMRTVVIMIPILALGVLLLFSSFVFTEKFARRKIRYLGLLSVISSVWIATESRISQIFFGNLPAIFCVSMILFSLLPLVTVSLMLSYQCFRNDRGMKILFWISVVTFILVHTLELTGVAYYMDTLWISQTSIVFVSLYLLFTFFKKLICREKMVDKDISLSVMVFGVCGMADILKQYLFPSENDVVFIKYGLLILMLILAFFAIRRATQEQEIIMERTVLKKLAYMDSLTGLQNRTSFEDKLDYYRDPLTAKKPIVMIVDLNELKSINDSMGHSAGDRAIIMVAHLLDKYFGRHSVCYRIGGDEFCVISEYFSEEKFEALTREFRMELKESSVVKPLSVSAACGWVRVDDKGIDRAIIRADEFMYEDKKTSKMSVC